MLKLLTRILLLVVGIFVIVFVCQRMKLLPSFGDIFSPKPVIIDNTPILVKEINSLSQLITITAYSEIVVDSVKQFTVPILPGISAPIHLLDDELVLVGKGKVLAGVDLAKITASNIYVKDDSASVTLPKAEILQVITNPSDFETFNETGNWTDAEVTAVKIKLRNKMITAAMQQNILPKATGIANMMMENFLRSAGFKKVTVK
ncbi:MAG TPA: DUF4230 domain-containing protein [Ferruginibacter sp.]|nr:DUF4230 domain-containing protein [Ferruginibacter sp.]